MDYSESEALVAFDAVSSFVASLGDLGQPTEEQLLEQIAQLEAIEDAVVRQSLFSENEELDEIDEENLKLISLPYLHAKLRQRQQVNRKQALMKVKDLLIAFVKLIEHYRISDNFVSSEVEKFSKDKKYIMQREEKVKLYQLEKIAKAEAEDKTFKFGQGSCKHLEFYRAILAYQCFDALNELGLIEREIEMLEFRSKLQQDSEFRSQYDQELQKPVPKPFYYKMMPNMCHTHANEDLPGASKNPQGTGQLQNQRSSTHELSTNVNLNPNLMSNPNVVIHPYMDPTNPDYQFDTVKNPYSFRNESQGIGVGQNHYYSGLNSSSQGLYTNLNQRQDILERVFQPDHAQPNMTMRELGDIEYNLMMEKQEIGRQREFEKMEYEQWVGKDYLEEAERKKVSDWDDYKDTHEKGAGNKNR